MVEVEKEERGKTSTQRRKTDDETEQCTQAWRGQEVLFCAPS